MQVVFKDLKHGEIAVIPENIDDIWHLYNIIEKGDLVKAVTFRTDEQKSDKIRSKKPEKKPMLLGIRVTEVKFHEFSDRLRIHGKIEEGPQNLGSFHTLNVDADQMEKITIIKEKWKDHHLQRIEEAVKMRFEPLLIFVSLDEDDATIAVLRQSGLQFVAEIYSKRSGKMFESVDTEKEYFGEIISVLKKNKTSDATLVILGPGFTKDHLIEYGKEKEPQLFEKYVVFGTSYSGINGIQEAIKLGIVNQITKQNRVAFETNLIEKLFEEIKKDGLATYGLNEVKYALLNGAVERLLISDTLTRQEKGEELLQLAKQNNSKFTIINTMHEAGKKIEGLGGVAAFLRYKIQ
ncbi:MAG: mRNA surveillance protein pelota [Candidatus Thermoplasmatota archaeon]|jgi:protein pelota|nr:mRNA surveillance protein pelota [Candidatus Thermoplasmatota archaeon]